MTRIRVALVLGVLAVLAVVATGALAVTTYGGDDATRATGRRSWSPIPGRVPGSRCPADGWVVRGPRSRIYYADDAGRPAAVVTGPAVYRDGYCAERPGDSNRGFAGFTDAAVRVLAAEPGGGSTRSVVIGSSWRTARVRPCGGRGFPAATDRVPLSSVELAMVSCGRGECRAGGRQPVLMARCRTPTYGGS